MVSFTESTWSSFLYLVMYVLIIKVLVLGTLPQRGPWHGPGGPVRQDGTGYLIGGNMFDLKRN